MRDYGKVAPQFWTGDTGKKLKAAGPEAVIVAMYLMTSPHANMIGLYYLPTLYLAHETGLGMEGASKGLARAIEAGFCTYDEASEHVFVHAMARFQIADALKPDDKRCKGVANELEKTPKGMLRLAFHAMYAGAFHLPESLISEAPSKPLASQEQEQEQENTPVVPKGDAAAAIVVDAYHRILPKCQRIAVLNPKRKKRIATMMKLARQVADEQGWEWDLAQFSEAYFGECAADPWMRGEVPNPKNPEWRQNLDVLLAEDRFAGVMDRAIAAMRAEA